jgi:hypothetical protein
MKNGHLLRGGGEDYAGPGKDGSKIIESKGERLQGGRERVGGGGGDPGQGKAQHQAGTTVKDAAMQKSKRRSSWEKLWSNQPGKLWDISSYMAFGK